MPLVTDHFYHVYNQGIDRRTTFNNKREYQRALTTIRFYQHTQNFIKLSHFLVSSQQSKLLKRIRQQPKPINLVAFCLMPNHFHFLIQQTQVGGISKYLADVQNSYTKYFNHKHKRKGSLFLNPFKAAHIETDEQLIHLVRYIHLNPYSSGIVQNREDLFTYSYSSLKAYFHPEKNTESINTDILMEYFPNRSAHRQFIHDQADYQKTLEAIKHLSLEEDLLTP